MSVIEHQVTVTTTYIIETTMSGHRPVVVCKRQDDDVIVTAAVYDDGDKRYDLKDTDSRAIRTRRWLLNTIGGKR